MVEEKKSQESKKVRYEINPDIIATAQALGQAAQGTKKIFNFLKGKINPGKAQEAEKLKSEIAALEARKKLDSEIAELKKRKAQLEKDVNGKDKLAYA